MSTLPYNKPEIAKGATPRPNDVATPPFQPRSRLVRGNRAIELTHEPGHSGTRRGSAHQPGIRNPGRTIDPAPDRNALDGCGVQEDREVILEVRELVLIGITNVVFRDVDWKPRARGHLVDVGLKGSGAHVLEAMRLTAHGIDGRTVCLDVLHDVHEVRFLIGVLDVVVVVQDQDGVRAILTRQLERLGDPRPGATLARTEIRRVVRRGVGRWLVHNVDHLRVREARAEGFDPVLHLGQGWGAAWLLGTPDEYVLLEDDIVRLREAIDAIERAPVERTRCRALDASPFASVLGRDLIPIVIVLHPTGVDRSVARCNIANELREAAATARWRTTGSCTTRS